MSPPLQPWQVLERRTTYTDRFLTVRTDRCLRSSGAVVETYHVIEAPDWVNVVALTPEFDVVMVDEYRHGAGLVLRGLPSGIAEPGEQDPEAAARRELREETGYEAEGWVLTSSCFVSAGTHNNRVQTYLAWNARPVAAQALDPNEEIEVACVPFVDLLRQLRRDSTSFQAPHAAAIWGAVSALLASAEPAVAALRGQVLAELSALRPS